MRQSSSPSCATRRAYCEVQTKCKSIGLNFTGGITKYSYQVCARHNQMQMQLRVGLNTVQNWQINSIVRSCDCHNSDSSHENISRFNNEPAEIEARATRPIRYSRIAGGSPVPGRLIAIIISVNFTPAGIS